MYWPKTRKGEAFYLPALLFAFVIGVLPDPLDPDSWLARVINGVIAVFVVQFLVELGINLTGLFRRSRRE